MMFPPGSCSRPWLTPAESYSEIVTSCLVASDPVSLSRTEYRVLLSLLPSFSRVNWSVTRPLRVLRVRFVVDDHSGLSLVEAWLSVVRQFNYKWLGLSIIKIFSVTPDHRWSWHLTRHNCEEVIRLETGQCNQELHLLECLVYWILSNIKWHQNNIIKYNYNYTLYVLRVYITSYRYEFWYFKIKKWDWQI